MKYPTVATVLGGSFKEMMIDLEDQMLADYEVVSEIVLATPKFETLKKNKKKLTEEERDQVMKAGAVWHHGPNGEETPAIWKSVVDGKEWFACNTHRAGQVKPTLKGAIKAFEFIKTTAQTR